MPAEETVPFPHDRVGEALAEYEVAREAGRPLDIPAFLAAHADIAAELAPLLAAAEPIDRLARPVREALDGRPPLSVPVPDGYEALEEIGRGGMGVVYKARQKGTEQVVALKLLRPDWLAGLDDASRHGAIEQFRVEARAAASLRHANRVRILHLGEHDGRPYYAMELIEGPSLSDKLKQAPAVTAEAAVRYLASVAEAVQEAHERGILHRDIKPHNILIDVRTDQALLADFGLAVIGGEEAGRQARMAGTLPYMSPEQVEGPSGATPGSDIYALGATLYEVLTGAPPFQAGSRVELIAMIREEAPAPPHRRRPEVNRYLEGICLRCLHKDPAERFRTARELADALRGFLEDVRYMRHFTSGGARMILMLPLTVLPHLCVQWMLRGPFLEPAAWVLFFSGYVPPFTLLMIAYRDAERLQLPGGRWGWCPLWLGHLFTALALALALRAAFPADPATVVLAMYPVLAALNGMAYFVEASKMPWWLRWGPIGFWLAGLLMAASLAVAPLIYCAYTALATVAYGLYLRRLGRELG